MDAMTQPNATLVGETAEAAQAMNEEASSLIELIAHYRIA
jgi:methyl-accepting chemotaxis protein